MRRVSPGCRGPRRPIMSKVLPAKGFRDFAPALKRRKEELLATIRACYLRYGFDEIETPAAEPIERLRGSEGGENLAMIFEVLRRGLTPGDLRSAEGPGDLVDLGLRYDLTVPLARYYASNHAELPAVFRAIQIGPVWRAEKPQKGRYRQFTQCDIDILGEPSALAEIELIVATLDALRDYQDSLAGFVQANGVMAALAYVAVYIAAVALSFPGASILTAAGGLMFGVAAGTAFALLSATIGATLLFLIARTSLGELLAERAGPRVQRLRKGFQEEGFSYLLFLRLVPLFPFWLVNLAAALFGMRLVPYVAATAIGIVPGTFVLAYFGDGLGTAIGGDEPAYWVEMLAGRIALLGIVVLIPVLFRSWRRRRASDEEAHS